MATKKLGVTKVNFGMKGGASFGILESVEVNKTAEKEEIKNEQGDIVDAVYHGQKTEVSAEMTLLKEDVASGPNVADPIGTDIALPVEDGTSVAAKVDSVSTKYQKAGVTTVSVSATQYPDLQTS